MNANRDRRIPEGHRAVRGPGRGRAGPARLEDAGRILSGGRAPVRAEPAPPAPLHDLRREGRAVQEEPSGRGEAAGLFREIRLPRRGRPDGRLPALDLGPGRRAIPSSSQSPGSRPRADARGRRPRGQGPVPGRPGHLPADAPDDEPGRGRRGAVHLRPDADRTRPPRGAGGAVRVLLRHPDAPGHGELPHQRRRYQPLPGPHRRPGHGQDGRRAGEPGARPAPGRRRRGHRPGLRGDHRRQVAHALRRRHDPGRGRAPRPT